MVEFHSSTHLFQPCGQLHLLIIHLCLELPLLRRSSSSVSGLNRLARGGGSVRGPASSTVLVFCNSGYHSVVAELPIEKLDNSSNGSLFQIAYSVHPVMVKSSSSDVALLHVSVPLHNTNKSKDEMTLSL
ncbi:hypothetical protein HID58_064019 [Brassica napus]|uniref:Uncharacterized protein n=1 Tax=Brassica napus TaxID=3708 RepID=A0ABQ7Z956_BRANA|nr:hypothetical protein HID58_064019 [Brassica napus]